jgi:hypothetical protein
MQPGWNIMAFTVQDFHDLVVILETQPAWRAEVRRLILTDDILGLPQALRDLTAATQALLETQRRHDERFNRVDADIAELKADVGVIKTDVTVLKTDMGGVKGQLLEERFHQHPFVYFSRFARKIRAISDAQLAELVEDAVEQGKLSEAEAEDLKLIDVVARGRQRTGDSVLYLAVEVSVVVDEHDLEHAIRRAHLLHKATDCETLPIVAGETILANIRDEAERRGVGWVSKS